MTPKQPKAIFFDLDGTLLPMEIDEFLKRYFHAINAYAQRHGFDGDAFSTGLMSGIKAMSNPADRRMNDEVFWEAFRKIVGDDTDRFIDLVDDFYENDFGKIGDDMHADPAAARCIRSLRDKGYPLFLTTMPMFPLRAVQWRLQWAGVDPDAFEYITTYDNSAAVKPNLDYYRKALHVSGFDPRDVLMVGNNTIEDLACMDLGIDAFLVTDNIINKNDFDIESVPHGTLAEFADYAETLPECR